MNCRGGRKRESLQKHNKKLQKKKVIARHVLDAIADGYKFHVLY